MRRQIEGFIVKITAYRLREPFFYAVIEEITIISARITDVSHIFDGIPKHALNNEMPLHTIVFKRLRIDITVIIATHRRNHICTVRIDNFRIEERLPFNKVTTQSEILVIIRFEMRVSLIDIERIGRSIVWIQVRNRRFVGVSACIKPELCISRIRQEIRHIVFESVIILLDILRFVENKIKSGRKRVAPELGYSTVEIGVQILFQTMMSKVGIV